jgi:hypothetical protein
MPPIDRKILEALILSGNTSAFVEPSLFSLNGMTGVVIDSTEIRDTNMATLGALAQLKSQSSLTIENSFVHGLSAANAGAISLQQQSSLTISNSIFQDCMAL